MTFMLLGSNDKGFSTIPWSALTTLIMMSGEIDYRDVFLDSQSSVYVLQSAFLVLFFLLMVIVVMNVFVGLAVGDTDEMMKRSKAKKRLHQVSINTSYSTAKSIFLKLYAKSIICLFCFVTSCLLLACLKIKILTFQARLYIEMQKSLSKLPSCFQPKEITKEVLRCPLNEKTMDEDKDKDTQMETKMEDIKSELEMIKNLHTDKDSQLEMKIESIKNDLQILKNINSQKNLQVESRIQAIKSDLLNMKNDISKFHDIMNKQTSLMETVLQRIEEGKTEQL